MIIAGQNRPFQYIPTQPIMPNFELLGQTLDKMQAEHDFSQEFLSQRPNYNQDFEIDREGYSRFMSTVDTLQNQIADAYMNKELGEARAIERKSLAEFKKQMMPKGDFFELNRRYNERQQLIKEYKENYKDRPDIAQYAIGNIGQGEDLYSSLSQPTVFKPLSGKEIDDIFSSYTDQIKDTALDIYGDKAYRSMGIDSFTTLHEFRTAMGRDFEDILKIVGSKVQGNTDLLRHFEQEEKIRQFFNPNADPIKNPTQIFEYEERPDGTLDYKRDDKGNIIFRNTPLAQTVRSYAYGRATIDEDVDRFTTVNRAALENYKHGLRLQEIDYETKVKDWLHPRETFGEQLSFTPDKYNENVRMISNQMENLRKQLQVPGVNKEEIEGQIKELQTRKLNSINSISGLSEYAGVDLNEELNKYVNRLLTNASQDNGIIKINGEVITSNNPEELIKKSILNGDNVTYTSGYQSNMQIPQTGPVPVTMSDFPSQETITFNAGNNFFEKLSNNQKIKNVDLGNYAKKRFIVTTSNEEINSRNKDLAENLLAGGINFITHDGIKMNDGSFAEFLKEAKTVKVNDLMSPIADHVGKQVILKDKNGKTIKELYGYFPGLKAFSEYDSKIRLYDQFANSVHKSPAEKEAFAKERDRMLGMKLQANPNVLRQIGGEITRGSVSEQINANQINHILGRPYTIYFDNGEIRINGTNDDGTLNYTFYKYKMGLFDGIIRVPETITMDDGSVRRVSNDDIKDKNQKPIRMTQDALPIVIWHYRNLRLQEIAKNEKNQKE